MSQTCEQAPGAARCLGCDNRHGCQSAPLCAGLERSESERALSGQVLMQRRGWLARCARCPLFRQCWKPEAYRRETRTM